VGLAAAVILLYASSLRAGFQFDDFNVIVDQPAVHGFGAWARSLGGLRPLLKATYTLNWVLGPGPFGFHLFNLGLHLLNVQMLFELGRLLGDRLPPHGAFVAALLFAIHPLQTEAVTYVCGRSVSLMSTFYLASLVAYLHGRRRDRRLWTHVLSPGLFLLACLTRETALTLPFALGLWEWLCPEGPRRFRPLLIHGLLLGLLGLALTVHPGYRAFLHASQNLRSVGTNLLSQVDALTYLLRLSVWPSRLNLDPGLQEAPGFTALLALKLLLLLAAFGWGVAQAWRRPVVAFATFWILLHLAPTSSLLPRRDIVNERHLYLAAWGLALLAVLGLEQLRRARALRPCLTPIGVVGILLLAGLTLRRQEDYRDEVRMWTQSVAANPQNPRAYNNLGCAYAAAGDLPAARAAFDAALRANPRYGPARTNLTLLPIAP
jgi:tetratricopeptide (TPR) repeat protein